MELFGDVAFPVLATVTGGAAQPVSTGQMVFSILVFVIAYIWLSTEKSPRYLIALCGAVLLILGGVFTVQEALGQVNWETIGLIFGMFTLVEALSHAGFFTWLALVVARKLNYSPIKVFFVFPLLAAFLSAFLDNITVMVFMVRLTYRLCKVIPLNPVLLVVAEVCAANTGGGATLVGSPPNVILGTMLGYSFNDFVIHVAPIIVVCTVLLVATFYILHLGSFRNLPAVDVAAAEQVSPHDTISDDRLMRRALIGVAVAILLLVTHAFIEKHFHIPVSVAMAALIPALTLMVITPDHGKEVLRRIDLESIVFFIGLFVIVGGLEKSGVFQKLAQWILSHVHTQVGVLIVLVWFSAIMSAFVDNVPMAVAMAYLVKGLVTTPGAPAQGIMVWALAMGLQMGGNMTPIGGSPNVVAYAALERENVHIGWPKWILLTVPPTVVTLIFATLCVLLKHRMGWY